MEEVVKRGITTFKHFMAYKGADGERRRDVPVVPALRRLALPLVHAENGVVR